MPKCSNPWAWCKPAPALAGSARGYAGAAVGSQSLAHRITAWSKFIRYSQQSLALGAGALLVIDGQLSPGGMIASNVLMTRALSPIDMMVSTWRAFIGARSALSGWKFCWATTRHAIRRSRAWHR